MCELNCLGQKIIKFIIKESGILLDFRVYLSIILKFFQVQGKDVLWYYIDIMCFIQDDWLWFYYK